MATVSVMARCKWLVRASSISPFDLRFGERLSSASRRKLNTSMCLSSPTHQHSDQVYYMQTRDFDLNRF